MTATTPADLHDTPRVHTRTDYVWTALRIGFGWIFLWAFLDKLFGLGFATERANAWVNGGSPTFGFLNFATKGPFAEVFQSIAGNSIADWLFMLGLLGVGISLTFGLAIRLGAYAGITMVVLMWLAVLPPTNNPFLDDHIIYAIALYGIAATRHTQALSLERMWIRLPFVKAHPALH